MAKRICKHCSGEISDWTHKCKSCGKAYSSFVGILVVLTVLFLLYLRFLAWVDEPKTPEEILMDKLIGRQVDVELALRDMVNDPASLKIVDGKILENDTVCINLRASNAYGAVIKGRAVAVGTTVYLTPSSMVDKIWHEQCNSLAVVYTF